MAIDYTYASARIMALEAGLLTQSQVELLISSKGLKEFQSAVYDTWFAAHLKRDDAIDMERTIERALEHTKSVLCSIVPDQRVTDMLWIKYDYHNLMAIAKGIRANTTNEAILHTCYTIGTYDPEALLTWVHDETLNTHAPHLAPHYQQASRTRTTVDADTIFDRAYFAHLLTLAQSSKDEFALRYARALIDMHNIKMLARIHTHPGLTNNATFVPGGTVEQTTLDDPVLPGRYERYGGVTQWKHAIQQVLTNAAVASLEKVADDALTQWIKLRSMARDDAADVLSYFHAVKNNAQIVSAIYKAKRSGMPERALRTALRSLYV